MTRLATRPGDAELADALLACAPGAAELAVRRYTPMVRGLLVRMFPARADLDDMTQETFLQFFRAIHTLREPERMRTFLVSITMRVARGELRRRRVRRFVVLSRDGDIPDVATQEVSIHVREAARRVAALIAGMRERERAAFELRYLEGLTLCEVAEELGHSLATTKRRIHRAHAILGTLAQADGRLADLLPQRTPAMTVGG